jgi:hypothetical protein
LFISSLQDPNNIAKMIAVAVAVMALITAVMSGVGFVRAYTEE